MPTSYTENPGNAPASYTLPSDLDDADAESVNLMFRALADNIAGECARLTSANTFTRGQIVDVTDAAEALLSTTLASTKDANPSNPWQLIIRSENLRLYSGVNTGAVQGGIALTYNAKWVPSSNHWEPVVTSQNAYLFSINYGNIYATAQLSVTGGGPANWATWPAYGSAVRGDMFLGRNMNVGGAISTIGGITTTTGNFNAAAGDYIYSPAKSRLPMPLPLSYGSDDIVIVIGSDYGAIDGSAGSKHFPLRFPANMSSCTVEIMFKQSSATPSTFEVYNLQSDWTAKTITRGVVGSATTPATSGVNTVTISVPFIVFDAEYRLRWAAGSTSDLLYAARATSMQDNGPLNTL